MIVRIVLLITLYVVCVFCEYEESTEDMDDLMKIVGGRSASPGDIPYQVRIGFGQTLVLGCGGIIFDQYHVLTASHCSSVARGSPVMAGSVDLKALDDPNRYTTEVAEMYTHPNFSRVTAKNDIAILRIAGKFTWSDYVKPAKMGNGVPATGTYCEVSGWGWTDPYDKKRPTVLQKTLVPIHDKNKCAEAYKSISKIIFPTMFCAGFEAGAIDACIGDSGGPLTCDGALVGLVSFGHGCAQAKFVGVYTDILAFDPWIKSTLEKSYSESGLPKPN